MWSKKILVLLLVIALAVPVNASLNDGMWSQLFVYPISPSASQELAAARAHAQAVAEAQAASFSSCGVMPDNKELDMLTISNPSATAESHSTASTKKPKISSTTRNWTITKPDILCLQVIAPAINPETGKCKDFPTPCDVPAGWELVDSCPVNDIQNSSLAIIREITKNESSVNTELNDEFCIQVITPALNTDTGECRTFMTPCDVPSGWQPWACGYGSMI